MNAATLPGGLLCLPGCHQQHGPTEDECTASEHVGTVPSFRTGQRLQVDCTAYTEGSGSHGYVEMYPAEGATLEGLYLEPANARALAAVLIEAADKAERLAGAVPAQRDGVR